MATRSAPYTTSFNTVKKFSWVSWTTKNIFLRENVKHKKFITRKFSDLRYIIFAHDVVSRPAHAQAGFLTAHAGLFDLLCANRTSNPADQMPKFGKQASLAGNEAIKQSNSETLCCILYNVTS